MLSSVPFCQAYQYSSQNLKSVAEKVAEKVAENLAQRGTDDLAGLAFSRDGLSSPGLAESDVRGNAN
ncbi:MAG: hypothetical protein K2Y32_21750, partial [Candidatus Obscuribacterales bacterium]|nr:hypothetical protein [Candidatus Obscuribacterales bacterium]